MDLASVVAALASVGVRVSGSNPNNNIQGDSSRACPTGLAGPEPSGTHNDPGQHFHKIEGHTIALHIACAIYSIPHPTIIHHPTGSRSIQKHIQRLRTEAEVVWHFCMHGAVYVTINRNHSRMHARLTGPIV